MNSPLSRESIAYVSVRVPVLGMPPLRFSNSAASLHELNDPSTAVPQMFSLQPGKR